MKSRIFFVVGDKFNAFAKGKEVLTIKQLKALLEAPRSFINTHNVLILGQGVQFEDVDAILQSHNADPECKDSFEISDLRRISDRADSQISHKRYGHNTLIGMPTKLTEKKFEIPFNIDERCELMGDHQTGQHVQGMILIEAFRQSFLAVTDRFFPFNCSCGQSYFVINELNTEFHNFLFPLPAHITYDILEQDANERRAKYRIVMECIQNGIRCASSAASFTVYPAEAINNKEAELAHSVTQAMISAHRLPAQDVLSADREEQGALEMQA